ncbi:FAD-binding domain-containing protein [Thozetella sp. PMI_491]|nr:FAD-binding domain-containing protein [Thozetella sp. PMI_491]
MPEQILPPIPVKCKVKFPGVDDTIHTFLDRWSHGNTSFPAAVVIPDSEDDLPECLQYAQAHSLRVVVGGGGHAPFVPITRKTLYLDMQHFKSIVLDEKSLTCTVGGAVLVRDLLAVLADKGFYTTLPFANSVGVVGAILGGGNTLLNGIHSFMADNVERIRITTASDGATREISPHSVDEDDRALFAAICGAGHGLGIITSLTMRMYRLSTLRLDEVDKIWQRRIVFSKSCIRDAARAMVSLIPLKAPMAAGLMFSRTPPGSPHPGTPIVVLMAFHIGPSCEAEESEAARVLLAPELTAKALSEVTGGITMAQVNNLTAAYETHGGTKILDGAFVSGIDEDTIVALFERYVAFAESVPGLVDTYANILGWDTSKVLEAGRSEERKGNFFIPRDRGIVLLNAVWLKDSDSELEGKAYLREMKEISMRGEPGALIAFPNNLDFPVDLKDYYPEDKLRELESVKRRWDPHGLLWSPSMGSS